MAENKGVKVNTTYNQYLKLFLNHKNHIVFNEKFKLNIIGIRKIHNYSDVLKETNKSKKLDILLKNHDNFDDTLVVFYNDENQNTKYFICNEFTTHPGYEPLCSIPVNSITGKKYSGTAILVEDQFLDNWFTGLHKGYSALIQNNEKLLKVYRDNNENGMLDFTNIWNEENEKDKINGGSYINFHYAKTKSGNPASRIMNHSEGCQVIRHKSDFLKFMQLVTIQKKAGMKNFSYTLINENEFNTFISNKIKEENNWYKLIKGDSNA